ncbi:hypothetical protein GCM10010430_66200 [Kitasatospora cystarginea]|uniref:Transposase n=1 Tax=Kitasatospora cystarginea TaxID=58350 RepID=A0ABP5RQH8_9ACTN
MVVPRPPWYPSQADALLACDFFETVTLSGARLHVLAVIEHTSRRIRILGATDRRPAGRGRLQRSRTERGVAPLASQPEHVAGRRARVCDGGVSRQAAPRAGHEET